MRGRARSLRGFVPAAVAGGFLALGWVALSIAFGSGSAQAAETPPPPSLLGTLQSTVGAVQDTITQGPATVQSAVTAVQQTVVETLPTAVADVVPQPVPVANAAPVPAEVVAPSASVIAPIVDATTPLLRSVDQTAGAAVGAVTGTVDAVAGTVDAVAPVLRPVLSPVDAVLHRVPGTLDAVTSTLPQLAQTIDSTVGGTVHDATGLPSVAITAPAAHGIAPLPVSATGSSPLTAPGAAAPAAGAPPTMTSGTTRVGLGPDDPADAGQTSASAGSASPLNPVHHPPGSPASESGMPGTGSATGGSAVDVRLLGTVSSLSAGDSLLTVRTGSAGDDRLPASPVADHDSSPD